MRKQGKVKIERAALRLFAERGIDCTATREITERAGLAEGTLFRHFRTKDELAISLFRTYAGQLTDRLDRATGGKPPEESLRAVVGEFFRFAHDEPLAYEYVTHRHPSLRDLPRGTRLPKDVVVEVVRRIGGIEPVFGAALVIGMVTRVLFFQRQGLLKGSPVDRVAKAAWRALT